MRLSDLLTSQDTSLADIEINLPHRPVTDDLAASLRRFRRMRD